MKVKVTSTTIPEKSDSSFVFPCPKCNNETIHEISSTEIDVECEICGTITTIDIDKQRSFIDSLDNTFRNLFKK